MTTKGIPIYPTVLHIECISERMSDIVLQNEDEHRVDNNARMFYTFRIEYEEDGQIRFDSVFAIDEVDAYLQFMRYYDKGLI